MDFILHWLITATAIIITAFILPGVSATFVGALIAALILGFLNAVIRPILLAISLPINALTLGLFTFVINAFLILLVSEIVPGFRVANFWWALLFSLILAVISYFIGGWI